MSINGTPQSVTVSNNIVSAWRFIKLVLLVLTGLLLNIISQAQVSHHYNKKTTKPVDHQHREKSTKEVIPCYTDQLRSRAINHNPSLQHAIDKNEDVMRKHIADKYSQPTLRQSGTEYIIPVVIHVVHQGEPVGTGTNISDAQIESQMQSLNEAFAGVNGGQFAVDTKIQFCLARLKPGNISWPLGEKPGVNRINGSTNSDVILDYQTPGTTTSELFLQSIAYPYDNYLNIFVVASITSNDVQVPATGQINGAATMPVPGGSPLDGIIIRADHFGDNNGNTSLPFNLDMDAQLGGTCVHEAGHYLNLFHTFEGACSGTTIGDCQISGDRICDTPPTVCNMNCVVANSSCNENYFTTGGPNHNDMKENYMDYTGDACYNTLTLGQADWMEACLISSRHILVSSNNLINTGIVGGTCIAPYLIADFTASVSQVCINNTVTFTNPSSTLGNTATTWLWTFTNGSTTLTSTVQNPVMTFTTPGLWTVALTVSDGTSLTNTETKTNYILSSVCGSIKKAQGVWHFGNHAMLSFTTGIGVQTTPSSLRSHEGCATMCDRNTGQMLFYTNGINVWDGNNNLVTSQLNANATFTNDEHSALQCCIIIPRPGTLNQYYIFTVSDGHGYLPYTNHGLCHTLVTVSGTNITISGLNTHAPVVPPTSEFTTPQITAVANCDGTYWIITHGAQPTGINSELRAYLVTPTGVQAPVISTGFSVNRPNAGDQGEIGNDFLVKASPDGNKVAFSFHPFTPTSPYFTSQNTFVYDFNKQTGVFSNQQSFPGGVGGISFSPNSQYIYTVHYVATPIAHMDLWRYDLTTLVAELVKTSSGSQPKLGPDNRIYLLGSNVLKIDILDNPNATLASINYGVGAITLTGYPLIQAYYALPNLIETDEPLSPVVNDFSYASTNCSVVEFECVSTCNSFAWNFGDGNTSTLQNPTHTYASPGNYTVTLVINGTTTVTKTISIVAPAAPVIAGPLTPVVCYSGQSNNYSISNYNPLLNYTWTVTGGGPSAATGVSNLDIYWTAPTGTVTVTVTNPTTGCSSTSTINVTPTYTAPPVVTVTPATATTCPGQTASLTASGASNYLWTPNTGLNCNTCNTVIANPSATTTYTVTGVNSNGCSNSANVIVTVNPLPVVTANATATTICAGTSVTLTGGGASSYVWNNGVINGVAFIPTTSNTYTVTGTDTSGCTNTANLTITVNANPTVTANASAGFICYGESVILTGSGATSYSWDNGVTDGVPFTPTTSNTYTVTGTTNGCSSTNSISVDVNNPINVSAITVTNTCQSSFNGSATAVASGGSPGYSYSWNTTPQQLTQTATGMAPGNYTVTVKDSKACTASANVIIQIIEPGVEFSIEQNPICETTVAHFTETLFCVTGSYSLQWNFGDGTTSSASAPFHTYSPGVYNVTVTVLPLGYTATHTITVHANPVPAIAAQSASLSTCAVETYAANMPPGNYSYNWSFTGTGSQASSNNQPTYAVNWGGSGGTVTLTIINNMTGCQGTQTITLTSCCKGGSGTINIMNGGNWPLGSPVTGQTIYINGTVTITNNVLLNGCKVIMNSGSKIIVNPGAIFALGNLTDVYACNNMWNGIIVKPGGHVAVSNAFIQDAEIAITSENGGRYTLSNNAKLIKNYIGISVKAFNGSHLGSIMASTITSDPAVASTVNTYPGSGGNALLLRAPHAAQRANIGIEITDVTNINIGAPTGVANVFDNMHNGIWCKRSNINVRNNTFKNMAPPLSPGITNTVTAGIWAQGNPAPANIPYQLTVGNGSVSGTNTFDRCRYGVYAEMDISTNIQMNTYLNGTDRSVAFYVTDAGAANTANVSFNSIQQAATGISFNMNPKLIATISNNVIFNLIPTGVATGIRTWEISSGNQPTNLLTKYTVSFNEITGVKTAITANGLYKAVIHSNGLSNNPIQLLNGTGTVGINVTDSRSTTITENKLIGVGFPNVNLKTDKGIYCSICPNTVICGNITDRFKNGIEAAGNCTGTTVNNNSITNNWFGFGVTNTGLVGPQGNSTSSSNNTFLLPAFAFVTHSFNSNGTASPIYTALTPTTPNLVTGGASTPIPFLSATNTPFSCGIPCSGCNPQLAAMFYEVAQGTDTYPYFQDNNKWQAKQILYNTLIENTITWSGDPVLDGFVHDMESATIGKLYEINEVIVNPNVTAGELLQAETDNNSLTITHAIEQYAQTINKIRIAVLLDNNRPLTSQEQTLIRDIAELCPQWNGYPVYQARAIIIPYDEEGTVYSDECPTTLSALAPNSDGHTNKTDWFNLVPNPNNGIMQLNYSLLTNSQALFTLHDMSGRVMYTHTIKSENNQLYIDQFGLDNGLYFYTVRVNETELYAGKVVINH